MKPRPLTLLTMGAALAVQGSALAQPAAAGDPAQRLFHDGKQLADAGDCERALPLFRQSHALRPARGPLFNIAVCEEKLARVASAWKHFRELMPDLPPGDPRLDVTAKHIQALQPRLPFLRINLAADAPPGTRMALDGTEIATADLARPEPLDPGDHTVVVTLPGRAEKRYPLSLREGEQRALTVEPGEAVETPPATAGWTRRSSMRTGGFASIGLGAAGVTVSALLGGLAIAKKHDLQTVCPAPAECNAGGVALARQGSALTTAATASAVAGLGLSALGIGLVLGAPDQERSAALLPAWRPGEGEVVVRVRF